MKIPMSCVLQHHISASSPGVMANYPKELRILIPVSLKYSIAMAVPLESNIVKKKIRHEAWRVLLMEDIRHQLPYIYIYK